MWRILIIGVLGTLFFACGDDMVPLDCAKSGPVISLGIVEHAASCSLANGSIKVSATQGKEPYSFFINGLPGQPEGQFNNLAAGIYTVSVKDANGCTASVDNVYINASDFVFAATISPDHSCLAGSGSVVIDVEDTNPPYTFQLGNGSFTEVNSFEELQQGNYFISVKDNSGCSVTLSITIPRGATGTSWTSEIKPIMQNSCAQSGCHNGSSRPDLRLYENAKFYAASIKSKTRDKSMPREGSLTQQQIDIISCWVDDGALEN